MIHRKMLASFICLSVMGGMSGNAVTASSLDTEEADTVVVTADRIPTKKSETPANITVITSQQIKNNRFDSVSEAIRHVNGVTVTDMVPGGSMSVVRLNGDERVAVLVDGHPVDNVQGMVSGHGTLDLNTLPGVQNIEKIEVVKGNGSALYGSNAVGGVINIITKKGTKNQSTLDLNTGSWGTHTYTMTNEGNYGKTSWFVTGELGRQGYYDYRHGNDTIKLDGSGKDSNYTDNSFTARMDQKINESSSWRFYVSHKSYDGNNPYFTNLLPSGTTAMERITNNIAATYNFKENTSTPGYIHIFKNYTSTDFSGAYDVATEGIQAQDGWLVGRHRLTSGFEWQKDTASSETGGYTDKKRTNRAFYAQDIIDVGKLSVTPGIRFDDNSTFGFHKTPKIALNYKANDKFNAYASWGRVFSAPTMDDLYYNVDYGIWGKYVGNTDLKPETGYSETIGFNYQLDPKTNFNVNWFQSKIDNAINWTYLGSDSYKANNQNEKKHGIELSMQKTINDAWNYELGYSYIYAQTDSGSGYSYDTGNSQPNGYRAGLHYAKNAWKANILMTAGTGRNTTVYTHNSYVILDASASYDVAKNTTIYAKMNNITNKEYEMYKGYPMPGRYFQLGVKYTF